MNHDMVVLLGAAVVLGAVLIWVNAQIGSDPIVKMATYLAGLACFILAGFVLIKLAIDTL